MSAWAPYTPSNAAPWNVQRAVHLNRRAAFGAAWNEIQRDLAGSPQEAVGRILAGTSRIEGVPANFESLSGVIGQAAVDSGSAERLKAWWLYRCLFSPHPLEERLTLLWHCHFATSNLKVNDLKLMKRQNDTFRRLALAPFGEMLAAMLCDPALLEWLDAPANRAGHPNENLGRELLELFTLGVGHYSEEDVKATARALTGRTVRQGEFRLQEAAHDNKPKTILGQSGNFGGDDLVKVLCDQPATARRLAWRLKGEFCGEGVVGDAALGELAEGLRAHHLDIRWGTETILHSELFFSEANLGSRVADPVSFAVGPLRALQCWRQGPSTLVLAEWVSRMGESLFYPPNVAGWPGGRAWLSTRTVVARANYAAALVGGGLSNPPQPVDLAGIAAGVGGEDESTERGRMLSQLLVGRVDEEFVANAGAAGADQEALRAAVRKLLSGPGAQLH